MRKFKKYIENKNSPLNIYNKNISVHFKPFLNTVIIVNAC